MVDGSFVGGLIGSVGDQIDPGRVALRWFGDPYPGARGVRRGSRIREEVSFGELTGRIERTAAGLRAAGMRPGDRVLFSIRPRPEGVILVLATIHEGGSIVFVDPGSTPELFEARLAAAGPRWAATEALLYAASSGPLSRIARARGLLLPDYARLPVRHLYAGPWLPGVPRGARRVAGLGPTTDPGPHEADAGNGREALVVFTSGTTSDPKAVVHTTTSLGGMLGLFAQLGELAPGQRVHTDQMFLGLPAMLQGATWEIPARTPAADPAAFARGIAGADASFAVPADVTALLDLIDPPASSPWRAAESSSHPRAEAPERRPAHLLPRPPASSTGQASPGSPAAQGRTAAPRARMARDSEAPRLMAVGAAPVTPALMERATRLLPETRWICVYGATEMLPAVVVDGREKAAAARAAGAVRAAGAPQPSLDGATPATHAPAGDLVGRPLDGVVVRIDAPDDDGVGELVISGPSLMAGYLADRDAGRPPAAEHRTGDLARLDDAGRLVLAGRTRDMIIRGTVNIYPGLFEPRLRELPGVADALLIGLPQPDGDEHVALVLVPDPGQASSGAAPAASAPGGPDAAPPGRDGRPADTAPPAAVGRTPSDTVLITADTPLTRATEPRLAAILDHGALPDLVVEASHVPLAGRSRKPDRAALTAAVTAAVPSPSR